MSRHLPRIILGVVILDFAILTGFALWNHGYWGIIAPHFQSFGAGQVFADLVIALSLIMLWMWRDAKANGRAIWPWLALTLVAGSFGPLLYLFTRRESAAASPQLKAA
jgi:hypothetical protein